MFCTRIYFSLISVSTSTLLLTPLQVVEDQDAPDTRFQRNYLRNCIASLNIQIVENTRNPRIRAKALCQNAKSLLLDVSPMRFKFRTQECVSYPWCRDTTNMTCELSLRKTQKCKKKVEKSHKKIKSHDSVTYNTETFAITKEVKTSIQESITPRITLSCSDVRSEHYRKDIMQLAKTCC